MRWLAALALLLGCGAAAGCGDRASLDLGDARADSNVRAADYVGPEPCAECHGERYRQWSGNLHRAMNRLALEPGAIVGDFADVAFEYAGGVARFSRAAGGAPTMELSSAGVTRRYRVTRTIGARYIQEYVGVQVAGPEPPSDAAYSTEVRLPYGYWRRERQWFHQQYFDSWFDDEYDADGRARISPSHVDPTPWATRCAWCHNTYPFELRLGRAHGEQPRGHGPEAFFVLDGAPVLVGDALPIESLVTVGISCESCHFGGRDHVGGRAIHFGPRAGSLRAATGTPAFAAKRADSRTINAICAQCHAAPAPLWPSGAAMRNSREALDLLDGACASAIKCTDCHDPHPRGPGAGEPDRREHLDACAACHPEIAASEPAHSRHSPGSTTCLDCHMPRVVQGFSSVIRSHRIGSPSAAQILGGREPDACGLCHLGETPRQLALTLVAWRAGEGATAGNVDIDRPIGEIWLGSKRPIVRVTAAAAHARSPSSRTPRVASQLLAILDDPIAYYRMRVMFALEEVLGRELSSSEYDPTASPARRREQLEALSSTLAGGRPLRR